MKHSSKKISRRYYLISEKSPFIIKESYNSIRTNLMSLLSIYEGTKVFVVTSPETSDGKTLTISNIAVSFAQVGSKVLLIDADMRKPKLHKVFKVPNEVGLSDFLGGFTDSIPVMKSGVENLDIVTAGKIPPDPTRIILSKNFSRLLKSVSENYDYVLFDAPPVNLLTDAVLISKQTLGCVLIARYNFTKRDGLMSAKQEIEKGDANLIGAILNDVDIKSKSYTDKTYTKEGYGYYNYNYGSEE